MKNEQLTFGTVLLVTHGIILKVMTTGDSQLCRVDESKLSHGHQLAEKGSSLV